MTSERKVIFATPTCAHVPACVGDDPRGRGDVDPVDERRRRLRHVHDDEDEEHHVGEGRVDAAVERHAPLAHEPRHAAVAARARLEHRDRGKGHLVVAKVIWRLCGL